MMKAYLVFGAILLAMMLALNCSTEEGSGGPSEVLPGSGGSTSQPIYNGFPPDAPEHDAVVGLHRLADRGASVYVSPFCSGTLIEPDVVVTAAHCLNVGKNRKVRTMNPADLAIYVGDDPSADILDHLYLTTETLIFPSYNPIALRNDIALVRLSGDITEPVTPVDNLPASTGFTSADVGTLINMAGFGETETGSSGVKLQVDVTLGSLGCYVSGCPDSGYTATQIAYAQSAAGPCFGDSGGPAFAYRGGVPYVGAVTSYGDSNCTIYGVSTRVDAFESWINEFIGVTPPPPDCSADGYCNPECATGADPDCSATPPPPPPTGCGDGECGTGESCDGRYGTESCPDDCAGKTRGKPSKQYCYVEGTCEGPGCP
jgi:secreted trypsin-like serine protease